MTDSQTKGVFAVFMSALVFAALWFGMWQQSMFAGLFMGAALFCIGLPLWCIASELEDR